MSEQHQTQERLKEKVESIVAGVASASCVDLTTITPLIDQLVEYGSQQSDLSKSLSAAALGAMDLLRQSLEGVILAAGGGDAATALNTAYQRASDLQDLFSGNPVSPQQSRAVDSSSVTAERTTSTDRTEPSIEPSLLGDFVVEARERLESAERQLLRLEIVPSDSDALAALFRDFHTIKGGAGMTHLTSISELAHHAENLMSRAREGKLLLDKGRTDLLLKTVDRLQSLVVMCESSLRDAAALRIVANQDSAGMLTALREATGSDKSAAVHSASTAPAHAPAHAPAPTAPPITEQPRSTPPDSAGTVACAPESAHTSATTAQDALLVKPQVSGVPDATVKVSTTRLDGLVDLVGELAISESMVARKIEALAEKDTELLRELRRLRTIARSLQDSAMSMRMVPIRPTFQKMQRLVRDLAGKLGKEAQLVLAGEETELDRNLVEAVGEPLMHMVRNSMDHGIEGPDQRAAAGKTRCGTITLSAAHMAGTIVIRIRDDGRGLNTDRILTKAVSAGLIRAHPRPSDQEIWRLIFHPGLSTAEKVSDVSGRGVGMDVVRRGIEAVRGRVEIFSTPGQGTEIIVRLPLTLAVIDGLVVLVGQEQYVVPVTSVRESVRWRDVTSSSVCDESEVVRSREEVLPLLRLGELFKINSYKTPSDPYVVIVSDGDQGNCALVVDKLLGQQQVVVKSLGRLPIPCRGISGGAILGDGRVRPIIDVPTLIDPYRLRLTGAGRTTATA